jgi:peptidyl-prolyl cis-trans isomerase C
MRAMAIQRLIDTEFAAKVTVSEEETRKLYETNAGFFEEPERIKASHILIKLDPKADASQKAEARKKIENIKRRLSNGEDFAVLAREFSQDPSSMKGGDLGYFVRSIMEKPFEDVAFAMAPGEVSDLVETSSGYHLIKVFDKKAKSTIPFEEAKAKLADYLKKEKANREVRLHVEQLKANAKVERFLSPASKPNTARDLGDEG